MKRTHKALLFSTFTVLLAACGGSKKTDTLQVRQVVEDVLACTVIVENATAVPVVWGAQTSPTKVSVSIVPVGTSGLVQSLVVKNSSGDTSSYSNLPLNTNFQVNLVNAIRTGQVVAGVTAADGRSATCAQSYSLAEAAPTPGNDIVFRDINPSIYGFDRATGFWFKRDGSGYKAFGKWPTGVAYDFVTAGIFFGDGRIGVIGRNPTTGQFYAAVDGTAPNISEVVLQLDPTKTISNFAVKDMNSDGRSDVSYLLGGIEFFHTAGVEQGSGKLIFSAAQASPMSVVVNVVPSTNVVPFGTRVLIAWAGKNAAACELRNAAGQVILGAGGVPASGIISSFTTPPMEQSVALAVVCTNPFQAPISQAVAINVDAKKVGVIAITAPKYARPNTAVSVTLAMQNVVEASCAFSANGIAQPIPATKVVNLNFVTTTNLAYSCLDLYGALVTQQAVIELPVMIVGAVAKVDFGSVTKSTSKTISLTIRNSHRNGDVTPGQATITGTGYTINDVMCRNVVLKPGSACNIDITFAAGATLTTFNGELSVPFNDGVGAVFLKVPTTAVVIKGGGK